MQPVRQRSPQPQPALLSQAIESIEADIQRRLRHNGEQRRKLLDYLKSKDVERYRELIGRLGLRR